MLTDDMKLWHGLVIAAVSLFLQACILTAISCLLSRHMAHQSERILKEARLQAPRPSPAHDRPPAAKELKETRAERGTPVPDPQYRHDSDTSSDSSDSSDSCSSSPPTCQATKDVNYTEMVFSAPGGLKNESAPDYENIKETTDYVNVNPESHSVNFWTSVNSASETVEYSQVAV
ncbi:regulator of hemoglobinization and erythroid cell expansion protein [Cynocephalus volans]|uniref:regulator of hemoglobinization and erythroid cell expansion protein n=1 Tax=Cynocephalus volans TaxID=110931 RepID=UPI002FC7DD12